MLRLPVEQDVLVAIQTAALVALCLRLCWSGLYRTYFRFFAYLVVQLIQTAVPAVVDFNSNQYLRFWIFTEGFSVILCALVVLDAYSNVLRDLTGIASIARRYIKIALAVAVIVSLLLVGLERAPSTIPQYFLVCSRTIVSSLLLFVLSALIFLVYYPVPLSRNVVSYSIGLAVYLLAKATAFFMTNLRYNSWYRQFSDAQLAAAAGCLVFWLFALNRRGETKTLVIGHKWNPGDEEKLLSQLQHINDVLLRAAKK